MMWLIIWEMIFWKKREQKNGKICDDYYSSFGKEHETDNDTYSLYDALKNNTRDSIYICISETINGQKYLVKGNNIVYLSDNG